MGHIFSESLHFWKCQFLPSCNVCGYKILKQFRICSRFYIYYPIIFLLVTQGDFDLYIIGCLLGCFPLDSWIFRRIYFISYKALAMNLSRMWYTLSVSSYTSNLIIICSDFFPIILQLDFYFLSSTSLFPFLSKKKKIPSPLASGSVSKSTSTFLAQSCPSQLQFWSSLSLLWASSLQLHFQVSCDSALPPSLPSSVSIGTCTPPAPSAPLTDKTPCWGWQFSYGCYRRPFKGAGAPAKSGWFFSLVLWYLVRPPVAFDQ